MLSLDQLQISLDQEDDSGDAFKDANNASIFSDFADYLHIKKVKKYIIGASILPRANLGKRDT